MTGVSAMAPVHFNTGARRPPFAPSLFTFYSILLTWRLSFLRLALFSQYFYFVLLISSIYYALLPFSSFLPPPPPPISPCT
jgi:hypothetical protein